MNLLGAPPVQLFNNLTTITKGGSFCEDTIYNPIASLIPATLTALVTIAKHLITARFIESQLIHELFNLQTESSEKDESLRLFIASKNSQQLFNKTTAISYSFQNSPSFDIISGGFSTIKSASSQIDCC